MQSSELPLNPINDERGHFLNLVNRHFEFAGAAIPRIDQINLTFVACDRLGKIRIETTLHMHVLTLGLRQLTQ